MNNSRHVLINTSIVLGAAILASGIIFLLSDEGGWLTFVAWMIFFASLQSPFIFAQNSNPSCSLLARFKKRS